MFLWSTYTCHLGIDYSCNVCMYVCVCVCVSAPSLLITNGMIWTPYNWLNKFYSLIWQLQLLLVVGVALELKYIMETNPIRVPYNGI